MIDEYGYDEYGNYVGNMFVHEPDDDLGYLDEEDTNGFTYADFTYDNFSYDDFTYQKYLESQAVKNAKTNATNAANALKNYGNFSYGKQGTLDTILNQYLNRKDFSYDFNSDALYQQYRDKYIKQGKLAMADTIGQAAAMTGGYGNSYAVSAGNQAYQASLENLNDIVPELYAMALERYNQQGQDLANKYSMLSDDRNAAYSMWSDGYNRLASDRDYYANRYDSERQWDYGQYSDQRDFAYNKYSADRSLDYDMYSSDRSLAYDEYSTDKGLSYQEYRNAIADEQWEADYLLRKAADDRAQEEWDAKKTTTPANPVEPEEPKEPEDEYKQKTWNDHNTEEYEKNVKENGGSYYEQVLSGVKTMKSQGKSWSEVISYLNDAVGNNYISKSEYATLSQQARKLWYPDRGSGNSGATR